jgi:beta-galactosidase
VKLTSASAGSESTELHKWQIFRLPLDEQPMLAGLKWSPGKADGPAFWRGSFNVEKAGDTFLDLSSWGKGVLWVNGHCLARYWNIGPTQTAYLPGPWLKPGANEIVMLDLIGPREPAVAGLEKPVLDQLHPELDFSRKSGSNGKLLLEGVQPTQSGTFEDGPKTQEIRFAQPVEGRQFCIETVNAQDGKAFAAIAELDLLDADGKSIPHSAWTIPFVDSEETVKEDGSALNAINGQLNDYWHTEWSGENPPKHPHHLIIDLGAPARIGGFRYTPRAGAGSGRIKDYRVYVGGKLVEAAQ